MWPGTDVLLWCVCGDLGLMRSALGPIRTCPQLCPLQLIAYSWAEVVHGLRRRGGWRQAEGEPIGVRGRRKQRVLVLLVWGLGVGGEG